MEAKAGNDVLDLFGLENDNDIDFETAYKMISNFDEEISLFDGAELPKLDVLEHKNLEALSFPHAPDSSNGLQTGAQVKFEELPKWGAQKADDGHAPERDATKDHTGNSGHYEATQALARAELLSRYESNAIEHFLDSLVTQGDHVPPSQAAPFQDQGETINMADLEMTKHNKKEMLAVQGELNKGGSEPASMALDVYIPPVVEIPDFSIMDSDIPKDVAESPTKLRKWKHVETERLRRINIKKVFDDLIGMTRYPRIADPKITKPSTEKRVPKHMLLNFILEDLRLIPQANEELEMMLKECDQVKS